MTDHLPQLPSFDSDTGHTLTDEKVKQCTEANAMRGRILAAHWAGIMEAVKEMTNTGGVPEEQAIALLGFLEHTISEQHEHNWQAAMQALAMKEWCEAAPDAAEAARRKMFGHLTILQANAKVAKISNMEGVQEMVAGWDYSKEFEDVDSWDWEKEKEPEHEIPQGVREAVAKAIGVAPEEIAGRIRVGEPQVAQVVRGEDGKLHVRTLSEDDITAETGMSKAAFIDQIKGKGAEIVDITVNVDGEIESKTSLKDIIGHLQWKKEEE